VVEPDLVAAILAVRLPRDPAHRDHRVAIVGQRDLHATLREMRANPSLETLLRFDDLDGRFDLSALQAAHRFDQRHRTDRPRVAGHRGACAGIEIDGWAW
jgi:hypothetical protein